MIVGLALAAFADEPAPPYAPILLETRFSTGELWVATSEVTTEIDGAHGRERTRSLSVVERAVRRGGVVGEAPVAWTERIARQSLDFVSWGDPIAWDSASDKPPPPGFEGLARLVGASFEVEVGADRVVRVTDARNYATDALAAVESMPAVRKPAATSLSVDAVARAVEAGLAALPATAPLPGEVLTTVSTVPLAAWGDVAVRNTWTLLSVDGDRVRLGRAISLAGDVPDGPLRLATLTGAGEVVFDVVAGVPVHQRTELSLGFEGATGKLDARVASTIDLGRAAAK